MISHLPLPELNIQNGCALDVIHKDYCISLKNNIDISNGDILKISILMPTVIGKGKNSERRAINYIFWTFWYILKNKNMIINYIIFLCTYMYCKINFITKTNFQYSIIMLCSIYLLNILVFLVHYVL